MRDKRRKYKIGIMIALIPICIYILFHIYRSYYGIQTAHYEISSSKITAPINMVVVADLHNREFKKDNAELITMILEQNPDAVLMIGDMMNDDSRNTDVVINLVERLTEEVPVYFAMGNHELKWERDHEKDLSAPLEAAGAIVLNDEYCDVEIAGQKIRLGGLYSYSVSFENLDVNNVGSTKAHIYRFLVDYQDSDVLKILLSHRPEAFAMGDNSKLWDIDLVISGHLHGGQIVLPYLGGVNGGEQGVFPTYVHGLYQKDGMELLITSGLGSKLNGIPRWNNPPEIVVLKMVPR